MVVLTTSETTTSGMLAVLADTSVSGRDVAAVLASVGEPGRHFLCTGEVSESILAHRARHPAVPPAIHPQTRPIHHIRPSFWSTEGAEHAGRRPVVQNSGILTLRGEVSAYGRCVEPSCQWHWAGA